MTGEYHNASCTRSECVGENESSVVQLFNPASHVLPHPTAVGSVSKFDWSTTSPAPVSTGALSTPATDQAIVKIDFRQHARSENIVPSKGGAHYEPRRRGVKRLSRGFGGGSGVACTGSGDDGLSCGGNATGCASRVCDDPGCSC